MGARKLKNIPIPVHAYSVKGVNSPAARKRFMRWHWPAVATAILGGRRDPSRLDLHAGNGRQQQIIIAAVTFDTAIDRSPAARQSQRSHARRFQRRPDQRYHKLRDLSKFFRPLCHSLQFRIDVQRQTDKGSGHRYSPGCSLRPGGNGTEDPGATAHQCAAHQRRNRISRRLGRALRPDLLGDTFTVQEDITKNIVTALAVKATAGRKRGRAGNRRKIWTPMTHYSERQGHLVGSRQGDAGRERGGASIVLRRQSSLIPPTHPPMRSSPLLPCSGLSEPGWSAGSGRLSLREAKRHLPKKP